MAMSSLELRHVIESGPLPLECRFTSAHAGELTVDVTDPVTRQSLVMKCISVVNLNISRAITNLIAELRSGFRPASQTLKQSRDIKRGVKSPLRAPVSVSYPSRE